MMVMRNAPKKHPAKRYSFGTYECAEKNAELRAAAYQKALARVGLTVEVAKLLAPILQCEWIQVCSWYEATATPRLDAVREATAYVDRHGPPGTRQSGTKWLFPCPVKEVNRELKRRQHADDVMIRKISRKRSASTALAVRPVKGSATQAILWTQRTTA